MKKEDEFISSHRSNLQNHIVSTNNERHLGVYTRYLVPIIRNIIKIELNDMPQSVCDEGDVAVSQQRIRVGDQCC